MNKRLRKGHREVLRSLQQQGQDRIAQLEAEVSELEALHAVSSSSYILAEAELKTANEKIEELEAEIDRLAKYEAFEAKLMYCEYCDTYRWDQERGDCKCKLEEKIDKAIAWHEERIVEKAEIFEGSPYPDELLLKSTQPHAEQLAELREGRE